MVADLEAQFDAANKDKNDAIAEQERCDLKLSLANRLITALSSEGERWAATVEQLKGDYDVLTGDMLFASAFVSYAGPFTASFRADLNTQFLAFMKSKNTPMTSGLVDPLKVRQSTVASMPADPCSTREDWHVCPLTPLESFHAPQPPALWRANAFSMPVPFDCASVYNVRTT